MDEERDREEWTDESERELGTQVFLDLNVRVREQWRRDEGLLDRLGID